MQEAGDFTCISVHGEREMKDFHPAKKVLHGGRGERGTTEFL